jgi:hypothetical protein
MGGVTPPLGRKLCLDLGLRKPRIDRLVNPINDFSLIHSESKINVLGHHAARPPRLAGRRHVVDHVAKRGRLA